MTVATTNPQGQPPSRKPSDIPAPGTLPKLPQTLFYLETDEDDRGASTDEADSSGTGS
jgi:hypothetical protein